MKAKYSFFMLLAACSMAHGSLFAQDRVITKKGDVMEVYNVEVSDKYIFFNREKSSDSTFERLVKDSVLMIRLQDGSIINISDADKSTEAGDSDVKTAAAEVPQPEDFILTPDMLDEQVRQVNAASIARMNTPVTFEFQEPDDLTRKANCVWYRMGVKENSVLDDGVVVLEMTGGNFNFEVANEPLIFEKTSVSYNVMNASIQIAVSNKSDRTVYIDLAKCFFVRMGQPQCYYMPSATSTTSTSSSGVGVNLGAVAGALGISGVAGTLASGVNVGGGGSKGSTTVTYAQRMLTVPPHTTVKLEPQYLWGMLNTVETVFPGFSYGLFRGYKYFRKSRFCFPKDDPEGPLLNGQHLEYDAATSQINVSVLVAYSFSEDVSASRTLSAHLYLKDLVGHHKKLTDKIDGGQVNFAPGTLGFYAELDDSKGAISFPRK